MTLIDRSTFEIDRIEHHIGATGHCLVWAYGTVEVTFKGQTKRVRATRWADNDVVCGAALVFRRRPQAPRETLVVTSAADGSEFFNAKHTHIEWA